MGDIILRVPIRPSRAKMNCTRGGIRPGFWGLWDLIETYGSLASNTVDVLIMAERFWEDTKPDPPNNLLALRGTDLPNPDRLEMARSVSKAAISGTRSLATKMNWPDLLPEVQRLEGKLKWSTDSQVIARDFHHLVNSVRDRLSTEYFFHVERTDVALYGKETAFGVAVAKKFNKATEDIEEAGKCLALQQPTACVFHLMRVMEIGVRGLGRKLKVQINVEIENWYQIMDHVDGAIRKLPAQTEPQRKRKAKLGAASANLNAVRIATRNEVMHPKQTYTQEQARDVYNATRAFMDHLAGLV